MIGPFVRRGDQSHEKVDNMYNAVGASLNLSGDCWTSVFLSVLINPTPTAGKMMAGIKTLMIPTPDKEADR